MENTSKGGNEVILKRDVKEIKSWHREAAKVILKNVELFYNEYHTFDGITEDVAFDIANAENAYNK